MRINPQGPAKQIEWIWEEGWPTGGEQATALPTPASAPGLCCPDNPKGSALCIPVLNGKMRI